MFGSPLASLGGRPQMTSLLDTMLCLKMILLQLNRKSSAVYRSAPWLLTHIVAFVQ